MSIVSEKQNRNALSGKYNFHSMDNNIPAFIRDGGNIPGLEGKNHYLVYKEASKHWYIQPDEFFLENKGGGYLRITTTGTYFSEWVITELFYYGLFIPNVAHPISAVTLIPCNSFSRFRKLIGYPG